MTRTILASELYAMTHDFNIKAVIKSTVKKVLKIPVIFMILCINFKSLYDCLIRLRTTVKKQFMINVMCLRETYEKREITKIK